MDDAIVKAAKDLIKEAQDLINLHMKKKVLTRINVILDRSGSMEQIRDDTIGGFNTFLKAQQDYDAPATMSIFQFDTVYETVYADKPLAEAKPLDRSTFVPRGGTALYDAICRTINHAKQVTKDGEKCMIVVITDGEENSSKEFSLSQVKDAIKQAEAKGWEVLYIGAGIDAFTSGAAMGVKTASILNTAANAVGTQSMYESLATNTVSFRAGTKADMSFTAEDKKKQEDAGVVKGGTNP